MEKNLLAYLYHGYLIRLSHYLNSYIFIAECILCDTFSFLNFADLGRLKKPNSDKWSQLE